MRVYRDWADKPLMLEVRHGGIPIEPRNLTTVFGGEKVEVRTLNPVDMEVDIFKSVFRGYQEDGTVWLTGTMEHFVPVDRIMLIEEV